MPRTEPYDRYSQAYEDWFVRFAPVYESELAALRRVIPQGKRGIEIGVGSGLFAAPLGISDGVEPSTAMAERARDRGITVYDGVAEKLPVPSNTYDFALIVTAICFVDDPSKSIQEMERVVTPGSTLIFGFVDVDTNLGQEYLTHKDEDPFYRYATFYSTGQIIALLNAHGFIVDETFQTVFGRLPEVSTPQEPKEGYGEGAFVVLTARKRTGV